MKSWMWFLIVLVALVLVAGNLGGGTAQPSPPSLADKLFGWLNIPNPEIPSPPDPRKVIEAVPEVVREQTAKHAVNFKLTFADLEDSATASRFMAYTKGRTFEVVAVEDGKVRVRPVTSGPVGELFRATPWEIASRVIRVGDLIEVDARGNIIYLGGE